MPTAFFFVPYKRVVPDRRPGRAEVYCQMDDFTDQIRADGGDWSEKECFGAQAIVKVRASLTTLQTINATPGFDKIPIAHLDDPTSEMTSAQRTAVLNKLQSLGFTLAQINAAFPQGWDGPYTLRDILTFCLSKRQQPRYDQPTDTVVWNGVQIPPSGTPQELQDAVSDDGSTF